jgi:hypothetical protein
MMGQTHTVDQSTKTLRELFVGNTPPGTQGATLQVFLNQAMQQVANRKLGATTIH